jgi:pimeloyl-ACP methyl ester carboxylesterase
MAKYMTGESIGKAGDEERYMDVGGFSVHYRCKGSGKPLVVLLHGSFLSMRSWRHVFDELSKIASVIAFDRPAFGYSSRPRPSKTSGVSYTPEAQSDLVVSVIRKFGYDKAVLVGNSTGGTLALLTALRHPGAVEGLVLAAPMVYSGYATSEIPAFMKPFMKAMSPLFAGFMHFMITKTYNPVIRAMWYRKELLDDDLLAACRSDFMNGDWSRAFWELFLETHRLGLDRQLKTLSLPCLVITGDHDVTVKTDESIRLSRELPSAKLEVVADCGHLPQEEKPEEFIDATMRFLEKNLHHG